MNKIGRRHGKGKLEDTRETELCKGYTKTKEDDNKHMGVKER